MKELTLALRRYEDDHGRLPPAAQLSHDGRPLLSWRVLILPYLEAETLYREFRLDEPWDSAHNRLLAAHMPRVFAPPRVEGLAVEPQTTFYQAIVGPGTPFEPGKPVKLVGEGLLDRPFDTLLLVEAARPVLWTAPEDVVYDPEQPVPPFGGIFNTDGRFSIFGANRKRGFNAALLDGSVHFLPIDVAQNTLRVKWRGRV